MFTYRNISIPSQIHNASTEHIYVFLKIATDGGTSERERLGGEGGRRPRGPSLAGHGGADTSIVRDSSRDLSLTDVNKRE